MLKELLPSSGFVPARYSCRLVKPSPSGSALGVARGAYEFHMLYGIKAAEQRTLADDGCAVRVLISYGSAWFPWYMRRLAERPANVWFVVRNLF